MKHIAIAAALFLLPISLLGQKTEVSISEAGPANAPEKAEKGSDKQASYGRKLLELAENEAAALRGGMRAFANLRLARAYQTTDKKKTIELLVGAFTATREIDDDTLSTRGKLQVDILKALAPLDASQTEELLVQIEPTRRAEVLQSLLTYYQQNNKMDRAIEVIYRISADSEFPYGPAAAVMAALPPEKSAELTQLFTTALASYSQNSDRKQPLSPTQDLTVLVTRVAKQLPPGLVKQAIAEILKQADPERHKDVTAMQISLASADGDATFSSEYQYKLFTLVPVLRNIDNDEAERLLKKNQEAAALVAKFPNGIGPGARTSMRRGGPPSGSASAEMSAEAREYAKMRKLLEDVEAHPEQALANVATLPKKEMRSIALVEIASSAWKKSPAVSKTALRQLLELVPDLSPDIQTHMLSRAADLYLKMEATDDAKRVVEKELAAAAAVLKQDTNADDPNKALKAYWPSTNAYGNALRTAGQISPLWALTLLEDLPDSEIRFCSEMVLAATWLHIPVGPTQTITATKKSVRAMMEDKR